MSTRIDNSEQALLDRLRSTRPRYHERDPAGRRFALRTAEFAHAGTAGPLTRLNNWRKISIPRCDSTKYTRPVPVHQLSVSQIPGTFGSRVAGLALPFHLFLPSARKPRSAPDFPPAARNISTIWCHFTKSRINGGATQSGGPAITISGLMKRWPLICRCYLLTASELLDHRLHVWLDRFRKRLVEKGANDAVPVEIGSLILGSRLSSSKDPEGFDQLGLRKRRMGSPHDPRNATRSRGEKPRCTLYCLASHAANQVWVSARFLPMSCSAKSKR